MSHALQCFNLSKAYGGTNAVNCLNLTLPEGRIIGLLGPNGSGKTSLIKLAAGLLTPTGGSITVCEQPVGPASKALVSYLPERPYFKMSMKVSEQLDFFQDFYCDFDRSRAESMLRQLGIDPGCRLSALSKGTKEKVQLVLVMSRRARLYLLDEPIAGVDPAARDYILQTIVSNYDPSATIVISTHLITDVEKILDEFLFLHKGTVIRRGTVDQVREETGKSLDELFKEVFKCSPNC